MSHYHLVQCVQRNRSTVHRRQTTDLVTGQSSTRDWWHWSPFILSNRKPLGRVHHNVLILSSDGIQMSVKRRHCKVLSSLVHRHQLKPDIKAWVVAVTASRRDLVVVSVVVLASADVQKVVDDGHTRTVHPDGSVTKTRFITSLEIIADKATVTAHHQLLTDRAHLTTTKHPPAATAVQLTDEPATFTQGGHWELSTISMQLFMPGSRSPIPTVNLSRVTSLHSTTVRFLSTPDRSSNSAQHHWQSTISCDCSTSMEQSSYQRHCINFSTVFQETT